MALHYGYNPGRPTFVVNVVLQLVGLEMRPDLQHEIRRIVDTGQLEAVDAAGHLLSKVLKAVFNVEHLPDAEAWATIRDEIALLSRKVD